MPSNVAARMTLAADPRSLQGAVAAGILGAGPVVLGASEECARLLEQAVAAGREPGEVAHEVHAAGERMPGFGHPLHKPLDPRAERILELRGRARRRWGARRVRASPCARPLRRSGGGR